MGTFNRIQAQLLCLTLLLLAGPASAHTFKGTNPSGGSANFSFKTTTAVKNFAVAVPGSSSAFSYVYLKKGGPATETSYDFCSRLNGQANYINLEAPQAAAATWHVRVSTPTNSAAHAFTLTVHTNVTNMRTARPVSKPVVFSASGKVAKGAWNYYRIEAPSNPTALKVYLKGTNNAPDVYIQRDRLPTFSSYLKRSVGQKTDTLLFSDSELTPGAYFIGVYSTSLTVSYTLRTEGMNIIPLNFDPGLTEAGTEAFTNQTAAAANFYFKVRTVNPDVGAWRTVLNVTKGEANLYLSRGALPTPQQSSYKSERVGSDGVVLGPGQFAAGQDWYVLVTTKTNTAWRLVSGAAFVTDLGELAANGSSGRTNVIGPEGWRFYKTLVPSDALAWRLGLGGPTNTIYLKKTGAPMDVNNGSELKQNGQMLVVPPYLVPGQLYFVGVKGSPGMTLRLDSRQQPIQDILFASTNVTATAAGYTTFRVEVPPEQIAWQINVVPASGNPNLYVRRNVVGNEDYNDAYSEVGGNVADSIALVPPALSDGTFFITVAATGTNAFKLESGPPRITDINYVAQVTNQETNRVGWRYFRVGDIDQQLGSLGWQLELSNFTPGTRIALRRSRAPSAWNLRNGTQRSFIKNYDFLSSTNFMQRSGHQADVWYVGVYNPSNALGSFTLKTSDMPAPVLAGDGGAMSRTNTPHLKWEFFRVDVPPNVDGWDVRLVNVTAGMPRIVVRREILPHTEISDFVVTTNIKTTLNNPALGTNWPGGAQWVAGKDWTQRIYGPGNTNVNQTGRLLAMGMGRPLDPATYYIGVYNESKTPATYTVMSRFIGEGRSIPVRTLAFSGGSHSGSQLAPREAAYYHVVVPPNSRSWKVKLNVTGNEAMLVASTNRVPTSESEKRVQKLGTEHFVLLPEKGRQFLHTGSHYLAVIGEGKPPNANTVGSGNASYTINSLGQMPEMNIGLLSSADLVRNDSLEGGESKAYHFRPADHIPGFYLHMENRVGNPVMVAISGMTLPDPGAADDGFGSDPYGNQGGENDPRIIAVSNKRIIAGAAPFDETVIVKARGSAGHYTNASYRLRVEKIVPPSLTFNGGKQTVTKQTNTWQFFRVDVPAHALGWDIRLTNIVAGAPKIVVCRAAVPVELSTTSGYNPAIAPWWPSWVRWAAGRDWTERSFSATGVSETGRILAMGMGRPLEAGTYYVGVQPGGASATYTLMSRGIGPGMAIPVPDLAFSGGSATVSSLGTREAAYFRVNVPAGAPSWKLKLDATGGESTLLVLKDSLPNVLASSSGSTVNSGFAPRKMQKVGNEHFVLLPGQGQTTLTPGNYYVAVVGEGNNATNASRVGTGTVRFTLTSVGALPMIHLGTISSNIVTSNSIAGGECIGYRFNVPPGTVNIEARLENRVGNPVMVMRSGTLPDPGIPFTGMSTDPYGVEGGEKTGNVGGALLATVVNPTNGIFNIIIKARQTNSVYPNASFTLRLSATTSTPLAFDGGQVTITNQQSGTWRHFRVDVPEEALGWDVRLTNVLSGLPRIVVRRDALPGTFLTAPWGSPGNQASWPSSNQWAAAGDWTRRQFSPDGIDNNGRILAMGMGRPLEPGSYYVGVANSTGAGPLNYTLMSRGIGGGMSIPVVELPFEDGVATNLNLPAREAAYYRVVVPEETPSSKIRVSGIAGEFMLVGLRNFVPNVEYLDASRTTVAGKSMQKAGNEHFLQLPIGAQTHIPAGTNYFAVVSEGSSITNNQRIGPGASSFVIRSLGALPVTDFGEIASSEIEHPDALEGGESKAYQFTVAAGVPAIELKLENRIGNPVMVVRTNGFPDPGGSFTGLSAEAYGNEGGVSPNDANAVLITIPNPHTGSAVYTVMVKARAVNNLFSDASYRMRIRPLPAPELNFGSLQNTNGLTNVVSGLLEHNQRAFFRVEAPAELDGGPVLGWKLELKQSSGLASVRARKDLLPTDTPATGTPFHSPASYVVPPVFTAGTWYVEVRGSNTTAFTLTSSPIELSRPVWAMPAPGETATAPGVALPLFGDSGINPDGAPMPGDQSIALDRGYQHFYAVEVPNQNGALLRVQLEAISGNPDIYVRTNFVPTISHNSTGGSGTIFERSMVAAVGTEYANWVPLDGKTETKLRPATWYFAVRAAGNANARYRLRVSTGNVQAIPFNVALTNQVAAGGDWRYYRFQSPAGANSWTLSFNQLAGDVWLYVRESIPPGNGNSATDFKHWQTDGKGTGPFPSFNTPGTYTIGSPPIKPGETYYLGFRALTDATFSFRFNDSGFSLASLQPAAVEATAPMSAAILSPGGFALPQLRDPLFGSVGAFESTLLGEPNQVYVIEVSSDLVNWTTLGNVTNSAQGSIHLADPSAARFEQRFYRIRAE